MLHLYNMSEKREDFFTCTSPICYELYGNNRSKLYGIFLQKLNNILDERFRQCENRILSELDRVQENLQKQIDHLDNKVVRLEQYYKISKRNDDNTALLLDAIDSLSKRIDALEQKIA